MYSYLGKMEYVCSMHCTALKLRNLGCVNMTLFSDLSSEYSTSQTSVRAEDGTGSTRMQLNSELVRRGCVSCAREQEESERTYDVA